ncbi:hypothetical protein [Halorussus lipolyticus]|uniref:hypothetical protein n=1 Tax=Halorussus lipolyticus TaxID=3034024 RepID=UPI0023E7E86B|nr:hypothetical protein [Halorussus sp. DT80]
MTRDDTTIDRRSLLKKTAVAGVTTGLAAGSASATGGDRPSRAIERDEAARLVESYGSDLLALLADENVLDAGDVTELATGRPASPDAPLRGDEGAALVDSGVNPARLVVVTQVTDGTLRLSVEPETGKSYALLDDGRSVTVFNPEVGTLDEDATTQTDHCTQQICPTDDGACYASSSVTYDGDRVATQASCCSYYKCTDP